MLGYTQGWVPPPPSTLLTPACPCHVLGTVLNILFHLLSETMGHSSC